MTLFAYMNINEYIHGMKRRPAATRRAGALLVVVNLNLCCVQKNEGPNTRVMIELDYEDAGPNTNKRSRLIMPTPDPEAPAPQP